MTRSQTASRLVTKGLWQLLVSLMKSCFLQLCPLLHQSSLTKHFGILSGNSEISRVHINQPLSSKKAQCSPSQLFLKAEALPQEGKKRKKTFLFSFSAMPHWSLFPFKCYLLFFIPCLPIIKMILLRQRQAKCSVASSSRFFIFCVFVTPAKIWFVRFERWLRTHLSWLFHF